MGKKLSRRDFLSTTARVGLGMSSLSFLPTFLTGGEKKIMAKAEHVIYLYMLGGMSHIDTFDPKPGTDVQGSFKTIKTNTGEMLGEHLPNLARQMDKIALIRSMTSKEGSHVRGRYFMHTNFPPLGTIVHPSMGSWILKGKGRLNQNLPGYVLVGRMNAGAGFFGSAYEPLRVPNPQKGLIDVAPPKGITESKVRERLALLDELDKEFRKKYSHQNVQTYSKYYQEATRMMFSEDVKAFDLNREDLTIRQRYGQNNFGQGCLMARRLVENGVRFVEVTLNGWDTHNDNFERVQKLSGILDRGLGALLADLEQRKLLSKTLVVLTTEFGRTPRINGRDGRDHYPRVFSALLAGAGIKGGQIYGSSDEKASRVKENPVKVNDFNATIATTMGLDPNKKTKARGRPFKMTNGGKAIKALLA